MVHTPNGGEQCCSFFGFQAQSEKVSRSHRTGCSDRGPENCGGCGGGSVIHSCGAIIKIVLFVYLALSSSSPAGVWLVGLAGDDDVSECYGLSDVRWFTSRLR